MVFASTQKRNSLFTDAAMVIFTMSSIGIISSFCGTLTFVKNMSTVLVDRFSAKSVYFASYFKSGLTRFMNEFFTMPGTQNAQRSFYLSY